MHGASIAEPFPMNAPRPGEILARDYRVERLLGVGGMGFVFSATRVSTGERVAIKMLLPELAGDAELVERFMREARAARRIDSEHCTRVFDVGATGDGTPYMVMEYLEGTDLSGALEQRGRVPPEQAVDWVLEACEAIAEAHQAKIVHRDLKPSNLFLARVNGVELVKVLDFGISKSLALDSASLKMTKTSALLGSPSYMSPEQLKSSRDVDERADIWALGIILYELTSGRLPFDAPSLPELSVLILSSTAPPLTLVAPGIHPGLAGAVATCLRSDRALRFTNLADFADAIANYGSPKARESARHIIATLGMPAERASTRMVTELAQTMPHAPASEPRLAAHSAHRGQSSPDFAASPQQSQAHAGGWRTPWMMLAAFGVLLSMGIVLIALALNRRAAAPAATVATASAIPALTASALATTTTTAVPAPLSAPTESAPPLASQHLPAAASSPAPRATAARPPAASVKRPPPGAGMFGTEN